MAPQEMHGGSGGGSSSFVLGACAAAGAVVAGAAAVLWNVHAQKARAVKVRRREEVWEDAREQ